MTAQVFPEWVICRNQLIQAQVTMGATPSFPVIITSGYSK